MKGMRICSTGVEDIQNMFIDTSVSKELEPGTVVFKNIQPKTLELNSTIVGLDDIKSDSMIVGVLVSKDIINYSENDNYKSTECAPVLTEGRILMEMLPSAKSGSYIQIDKAGKKLSVVASQSGSILGKIINVFSDTNEMEIRVHPGEFASGGTPTPPNPEELKKLDDAIKAEVVERKKTDAAVTTLKADATSLKTDVGTLKTDVADLKTKVQDINKGGK